MASKDARLIKNAVRVGRTVYRDGMEDELEGALSSEQIARLQDRGAIEGFNVKTEKSADKAADHAPKGKDKK